MDLKIVHASTMYQVKVDKAEEYFNSVFVHNLSQTEHTLPKKLF